MRQRKPLAAALVPMPRGSSESLRLVSAGSAALPASIPADSIRSMNPATREYVEELAARPEVGAVILFGSQARGDARPNSDVDLVVLVPAGYRRALDERDGQTFELMFLSDDAARGYFRQNLDGAAEFWATAQILFDRDGAGSRLRSQAQQMLAAGKPALDEGTLTTSRFNAEDQLRAVEALVAEDLVTASALLHKQGARAHRLLLRRAAALDAERKAAYLGDRGNGPRAARAIDGLLRRGLRRPSRARARDGPAGLRLLKQARRTRHWTNPVPDATAAFRVDASI